MHAPAYEGHLHAFVLLPGVLAPGSPLAPPLLFNTSGSVCSVALLTLDLKYTWASDETRQQSHHYMHGYISYKAQLPTPTQRGPESYFIIRYDRWA
jgi:hypothetical protein